MDDGLKNGEGKSWGGQSTNRSIEGNEEREVSREISSDFARY